MAVLSGNGLLPFETSSSCALEAFYVLLLPCLLMTAAARLAPAEIWVLKIGAKKSPKTGPLLATCKLRLLTFGP